MNGYLRDVLGWPYTEGPPKAEVMQEVDIKDASEKPAGDVCEKNEGDN
jgi:hypothetical protein